MWIMVFFDLPVKTNSERKRYAKFRKDLMKDGFEMLQFSVYIRHCSSRENKNVHVKRVKEFLPKEGNVGILYVTDQQFGTMEIFYGKQKAAKENVKPDQLELF